MEINSQLILAIFASLVAAYIIYTVNKKTGKRSMATLAALVLGLGIGIIFKGNIPFLKAVGKGYMSLIKMIVIPLVMTSIITSLVRFKNIETLKSIGFKAVAFLLGTTGIAAAIGIVIGKLFNVGEGVVFTGAADFTAKEIPALTDVFLGFIPENVIASIANGKIIPVVVFSIFVAIALVVEDNKNPEKIKAFKDFILATYEITMNITRTVLKFIPYGVFGLIATAASNNGLDTILSLATVVAAVYVACILQILFIHTPLVSVVARKNPVQFFKDVFPAMLLAFTSQSSYGTLPVTIDSLINRAKVRDEVATFTASLGSTMGMNACGGLYPAIVAIFVAKVFNIDLSMYHYILIIATTIVGSIGIAGVPGAATMSTTVVLTVAGLPLEGMAMVMAVDSIIDMARTSTNVTGTMVTAVVVDELDKRKEARKKAAIA
ncbi:MAG: dicarboxylate/amino acid:cation symporter [Clostridiales bacterium]|nr:dicarboxylate/amino acid:cation symporter [Clostridiales bacterium]